MERDANYLKVIVFMALIALGLTSSAVWLSELTSDRQEDVYDVIFYDQVRGLAAGSDVEFNGVAVGRVSRLSLDRTDPSRVIARIGLRRGTPLRAASEPRIKTSLIGGAVAISIAPGASDGPLLKAQYPPPNIPRLVGRRSRLDAIMDNPTVFVAKSQAFLVQAIEPLADENIVLATQGLRRLEHQTTRLRRRTPGLETLQAPLASSRRRSLDAQAQAAAMRHGVAKRAASAARERDDEAFGRHDIPAMAANASGAEERLARVSERDLPALTRQIEAASIAVQDLNGALTHLRDGPLSKISGGAKRRSYRSSPSSLGAP